MLDRGIKTMGSRGCFRCGKELLPGGLFYIVYIKIFSGFDGILTEPTGDIDQHLNQLLEQAKHLDPKELEKDIYEEITLIVCKSCRDRFVNEAQRPWEGPFQIKKDPDQIIH